MKLNPGDVICNKCNGEGIIKSCSIGNKMLCSKCYGTGKLDWIENIVGKVWGYDVWYAPAGFVHRRIEVKL